LPSAVNEISVVEGDGKIAETGKEHSTKISLIMNEPLTLSLTLN
jgi:hypothetical protein